jgi:predicted nuclease of predicted toxin-antitoxin system
LEKRAGDSVIKILADHDIEGYAVTLLGTLAAEGWLELIPLELVTFDDVGLPIESTDREVWRFAQANEMILITNNRNMKGEESLEQTLREENTITSLPILTISNVKRMADKRYRERCAAQILEIVLDLDKNLGRSRIYIP